MRWSQYFLYTLREEPADADVISQKLMIRSGMLRKVAAGIYTYLPLGLRSLKKLEIIVREEMNRAGAIELLMPAIQPGELWMESGRWKLYGRELLRIKDRHDRDFLFAPTAEEVITDTVRDAINSYRQLPELQIRREHRKSDVDVFLRRARAGADDRDRAAAHAWYPVDRRRRQIPRQTDIAAREDARLRQRSRLRDGARARRSRRQSD